MDELTEDEQTMRAIGGDGLSLLSENAAQKRRIATLEQENARLRAALLLIRDGPGRPPKVSDLTPWAIADAALADTHAHEREVAHDTETE